MVKINNTVKGIIIGVLACGLLGFGALADVAYLDLDGHVDFSGFWGDTKYFSPIAFAIIVGILLGISTASQSRPLKKISIVLTIILGMVILGVFAYCVWYRFNNPGAGMF